VPTAGDAEQTRAYQNWFGTLSIIEKATLPSIRFVCHASALPLPGIAPSRS
jgi:hypothetical protein